MDRQTCRQTDRQTDRHNTAAFQQAVTLGQLEDILLPVNNLESTCWRHFSNVSCVEPAILVQHLNTSDMPWRLSGRQGLGSAWGRGEWDRVSGEGWGECGGRR